MKWNMSRGSILFWFQHLDELPKYLTCVGARTVSKVCISPVQALSSWFLGFKNVRVDKEFVILFPFCLPGIFSSLHQYIEGYCRDPFKIPNIGNSDMVLYQSFAKSCLAACVAVLFSLTYILLLLITLTSAFALYNRYNLPLASIWHSWPSLGQRFSFPEFHGPQLDQDSILLHVTKVRQFNQIGLKFNSGGRLCFESMTAPRNHQESISFCFSALSAWVWDFFLCGCKVTAAPLRITFLCC